MRCALVLAVLAVLAGTAARSGAGVITQSSDFELSTLLTVGGVATADPGFAFLERFDASLGTLTRVDIDIMSRTVVTGNLPLSQICTLGCILGPYSFSFRILHDFGLWPLPGDPTTPRIQYQGLASGQPLPFASTVDVSHSISFTALTDTIGFTTVSSSSSSSGNIESAVAAFIPPIAAYHELGDFDAPFAGIPLTLIFPVLEYTWTGQGRGVPVTGNINSSGTITLSYTYEEDAAVPAPEPSVAALLLLGLSFAPLCRRRGMASRKGG